MKKRGCESSKSVIYRFFKLSSLTSMFHRVRMLYSGLCNILQTIIVDDLKPKQ